MVEPVTVLGTGALIAYLGKDGVSKLLGPTAEYLGGETKHLVERCNVNLGAVFGRALRRLGERAEAPGGVDPRVLKRVLAEAPLCDGPVVQEYFAGLLASSRTADALDDQGVPYLDIISGLSATQIRFHYQLYSAIRTTFIGKTALMPTKDNRRQMAAFLSETELREAFGTDDGDRAFWLLEHCLYGMVRNALIAENYVHGSPAHLAAIYPGNQFLDGGVVVFPAPLGFDLWLWVHGAGGISTHRFLDADLRLGDPPDDLPLPFTLHPLALPPRP